MVARGDLGVLADYKQIPQLQKKLIDSANKIGKPVIVATQMLESMVERPRPWRPEVQDISTAIEEGADALMLSEETAIGKFPKEAVSVMAAVINENTPIDVEEYVKKFKGEYAVPNPGRPIDVLGFAICEVAKEAKSPFILSYATTGISATLISRFRPRMPVITITNKRDTARKLCLLYNVYPVLVKEKDLPRDPQRFIKFLREIVAELDLSEHVKKSTAASSSVFLVGTQDLTRLIGEKAQGIFVFEP
jgi:pyruvate kinase